MNALQKSQAEQYMHETLSWERAMAFYRHENTFFKTRLSQALDNSADKHFTEWAEEFNSRFIFNDEYTLSLLKDVQLQKSILERALSGDHTKDVVLQKFQQKLREEIEKFENDIAILKTRFNQGLLAVTRPS